MAGNLSNYAEKLILELSVGKTAWTRPNVWAALYTVAPTDSTAGTEVSGGNYSRVPVSDGTNSVFAAAGEVSGSMVIKNTNNFNATSNGITASGSGIITFPQSSAAWGTVVAVALVDDADATEGNVIWYGTLTNSKIVGTSDTVSFAAGDLQLSID